ncbi:MAG TPA: phosphatidylserine decarboxylase family protein [Gemmatimonadales bacterium]|nr:phosphatidylserine decarboxylase family protein [Gemmatimonadales bacterium]
MPIAREGWPFIIGAVAIALLLWVTGWWFLFVPWVAITIWIVAFFRNPERPGPRGEELVIAPADGLVVSIISMDEPAFIGGAATRVSIFMNVFDVHVNRYPASGTVAWRQYHPGRFLNAATEKASRENEQSSIGLETPRGKILVRQIAGLVARRIITDHPRGATVIQGDRLGLIRFGSRVDVFLPPGTETRVREGERTRAGQTVIATWT